MIHIDKKETVFVKYNRIKTKCDWSDKSLWIFKYKKKNWNKSRTLSMFKENKNKNTE